MQPLEHPGFWWRPDHPDRHMPGVLIFRPGERARLELFDAFFPLPEALARVFTTHTEPIILGESSTGEKITLMGCAEFPGQPAFDRVATPYESTFLLIGQHFARPEDAVFPVVEVRFTNLEDWTGRHGFTEASTDDGLKFDLGYAAPPVFTATVPGFTITLSHRFERQAPRVGERRLVQSSFFRIAAAEPMPLGELLNGPVITLRSLLAFATNTPVHALAVDVYPSNPPNQDERITVFCNSIGRAEDAPPPTDLLFSLTHIADHYEDALRRWFADSADGNIGPVMELYLGTLYGDRMFTHHECLSLAQALEALHGRGGYPKVPFLNADDFKALEDAFTAAIPERFPHAVRDDIKRKIRSMNQATLAQRLNALIDAAPPVLLDHPIRDRNAFAASVRDTRNFLTHHDETSRKRAARRADLLNLNDQMRWLLASLLLKRLGMTDDNIRQVLFPNGDWHRAASWQIT